MSTGLATSVRTARAQVIVNAIDAGAGAGVLKFYDGTRPATGAAITTHKLLVVSNFDTIAGTVTDGVITFNPIADSLVILSGIASWCRIEDSDGNFVVDLSCGLVSAEIILDETTLIAGGLLKILSGSITEGNL